MRKLILIVLTATLCVSCGRDLSNNVYTSDSTLSLTLKGTIISARNITIQTNDKLSDNTTGILAGGLTGGVAGANVGGGNGKAAATVGGALVGAAIGSLIEQKLSKSQGAEYIVKVDVSDLNSDYYEGNAAMRNAISSATTSGLITIVQGVDNESPLLAEGTNVYVIYSENRSRVIAAN